MSRMQEWKAVSLTGRLCYLFMCIERYLVFCYPDRDWTPLARKMWAWTEDWWSDGCYRYSHLVPRYLLEFEIVPQYLLEFDIIKEINEKEFDGELSEQEYNILVKLYAGITNGSEEDEINEVLMLPLEFDSICECSDFSDADEPTIELIAKAQAILLRHSIDIPSIDMVSGFSVHQKNGWGDFVDSTYLSIILNT